ncbi:MAG: GUN4 domain-containing protein [Cyanobacteriota bacterium]
MPEDELTSAVGTDYTKLRQLLADGNWKDADLETEAVMLSVAGISKIEFQDHTSTCINGELVFINANIEKFPSIDLVTINQLWTKYSKGHFGFSVQQHIWEKVGKDSYKLAECNGWHNIVKRTNDIYREREEAWNSGYNGDDYSAPPYKNPEIPYHDDLIFSLKAPLGHLPAAIYPLDKRSDKYLFFCSSLLSRQDLKL